MTTANLTLADNDTVIQYTAVGGETAFEFDFPILDEAELAVSIDQVDQVLGTDYTVSGVGDEAGGTVTLTASASAGEVITLWLDMDIKRLTGFSTGAAVLTGAALNAEFARQVRHDQMLRRDIRRALRLAPDDPQSGQDMEIPTQSSRAGKFLAFDASGRPTVADVTGSEDTSLRGDLASSDADKGYNLVAVTPTALELSTAATIVNAHWSPGYLPRYGGSPSASASTNDQALADALLANHRVVIPFLEDGIYDVSSSFTLGKWGQQLIGEASGEGLGTAGEGVVLNVVAGFPLAGGDAAQSVIQLTDRYQHVKHLTIDCNSIAEHGIYGDGGEVTHGSLRYVTVIEAADDGIHFGDNTWMWLFDHVRVSSPAGFGFGFYGSSGITTLHFICCYVSGATSTGGFRLDAVTSFVMDACAVDASPGFALVLGEGSQGVVNGINCEGTVALIDMAPTVISGIKPRLVVHGGRFLNYGSDASPPATLIDNGGALLMHGVHLAASAAFTAFLTTTPNSYTSWRANTIDIEAQTNAINTLSVVESDGLMGPRQLGVSSGRTLALSDRGKAIRLEGAGSQTVTIPPNASVAFPVGTRIEIINAQNTSTQTLARGSGVSLYRAGTNFTDADVTLTNTAVAYLRKIGTDSWIVDGTALS